MWSTDVFGRIHPIRTIINGLSSLPRRRPLWWTPSRSTTGHFIRYHIDDARQSATPPGGTHEIRDTVQSEYLIDIIRLYQFSIIYITEIKGNVCAWCACKWSIIKFITLMFLKIVLYVYIRCTPRGQILKFGILKKG